MDQQGKKQWKLPEKNGWCAANCGAQPIIPQNPARVTLIQVDRRALTNKIRRTKAITTKNNFNIKNFNKRTLIQGGDLNNKIRRNAFSTKTKSGTILIEIWFLDFEFYEICIFP